MDNLHKKSKEGLTEQRVREIAKDEILNHEMEKIRRQYTIDKMAAEIIEKQKTVKV